jgi:hypothetical protein
MHIGNYAPIAVIAFFIIANLWKRFSNATVQAEQAAADAPPVAPRVTAPAPSAPAPVAARAPSAPPPRRRLVQQSAPLLPPVAALLPSPQPAMPAPVLADAFPAEAAAAFDVLDLSLPGAGVAAVTGAGRPRRTIGSAAVLGSRGWGPGAIVAMEVLGPPVAVRPGATLGASHAL